MADQLITGTTLVEKESRSAGDIPVGGIVEWDDTFSAVPENYRECNGGTVNDPSSPYVGTDVPDLNTNYMSITGTNFTSRNPSSDDIAHDAGTGNIASQTENIEVSAVVNLPHGSTITEVIVYGNGGAVAGTTWVMKHSDQAGASVEMAGAAVGTEDEIITNPIIDNENRAYWIETGVDTLDTSDDIYGARITHEPRFKFIIRIK